MLDKTAGKQILSKMLFLQVKQVFMFRTHGSTCVVPGVGPQMLWMQSMKFWCAGSSTDWQDILFI